MKTGQLIQGVVTKIDSERKIVHLSSDPDSVAKFLVCLEHYFANYRVTFP